MTVFVVSLGCAKNLVETEIMTGALVAAGHGLTFDQREADVTLVNTCAFLPSAREEAFRAIREAVRWKKRKPGRRVAVAGCLIPRDRQHTFLTEFPEVDLWLGPNGVRDIARALDGGEKLYGDGVPCFLQSGETPRLQLTAPHVAYLKIADGCNNRCAYCSIPMIRGNLRSRPLADCVKEAANLLKFGAKELVVIGQDVTAFGMDNTSGDTLAKLLKELDSFDGEYWVRLLYTHPAHYNDELIAELRGAKHLVPYLDVPLQHISDRILRAMGRKAGKSQTMELLNKLRAELPDATLRTTFIAGLPGETEAEFNELRDLVREFKFDRVGVFEYAPEPGTSAAEMPDQVPPKTASARAAELMELQRLVSKAHNAALVGSTVTAIVDEAAGREGFARGSMHAPDEDGGIHLKSSRKLREGEFYRVKITGSDDYDLAAEVLTT